MKKICAIVVFMLAACSFIEEKQQQVSNFSITPVNGAWNFNLKRDEFWASNDKMRVYVSLDSLKGEFDKQFCTDSRLLQNKIILKMRGTGNYDNDYFFDAREAYVIKDGVRQRMFIELPSYLTKKVKIKNLENRLFGYEYGIGCDRLDGLEFSIEGLYDDEENPLQPIHFRVNYIPQPNPQKSELWKFNKKKD